MSDSATDPVTDVRDNEPVDGELLADDVAAAEAAVVSDLDQLQAERDELRTVAQRLQADFENYKKRMLREQTSAIERANERLLESLLPALDSFEFAQRSLESLESLESLDRRGEAGSPNGAANDSDIEKVQGGVLAAIRQLIDLVAKEGLERIEALGAPFDPAEHEAVLHDDSGDGEAVVEVFRTGYRLKGRVIRPAMVKVGPASR